jgi:hypothetical protein
MAGLRIIDGTDGHRHLVDAGGVRNLTEESPGFWDLAMTAGNWAAIQGFARAVLATPDPDGGRPEVLPALPADVTDQVTAQMCAEAGHSCIACPVEVRSLYASAHNAVGAVRRALEGGGDWSRAKRKLAELEETVARMRLVMDGHAGALDGWRRP